jgi:hypothetical protein
MPLRRAFLVPALLSMLAAPDVPAHDGYLDSYGCHTVQATGRYHCHLGPLAGQEFKSKEAMREALKESERRRHSAGPASGKGR